MQCLHRNAQSGKAFNSILNKAFSGQIKSILFYVIIMMAFVLGRGKDPRRCNRNREDICLQTSLLLFKYANHKNKRSFLSTTNEALVGIFMTIGDVNNIFPIRRSGTLQLFSFSAVGCSLYNRNNKRKL